ncbi:MAG: hypothetical protein R3A80_09365 [Bdellovibrionota bacterium]
MKKLLLLIALTVSAIANATVFVDFEKDPLPLIKINFLIPSARATQSDTENLGLKFLSEFYDSGTKSLSRQQFKDALSSYGASLSISTGYQYAEISTTFPLNNGKVPEGLITLIKDAWENPRVDKENFNRAQKYLKASHMALLDRESSLLSLAIQKIVAIKLFKLFPYSIESFDKIKLNEIAELHKNFYSRDSDIWVGIIAPENLKKDLFKVTQNIFPKAGNVKEGILKTQLKTAYMPEQKEHLKPTFLVIDKKDLAQIHYGFVSVAHDKTTPKTELTDNFTYHVLAGGGLESIYGKRIREERGISYVVGGLLSSFYEYPIVSLYANPQRSKQAEAFEVLDKIVSETFTDGKIISSVQDSLWSGWLLSFRNGERQSGATPEGRLSRRKDIATGDLSYELYQTPIDDWSVKKAVAAKRLGEFAQSSSLVLGAVGDATELNPFIKKYFPTYNLIQVNYKEVLKNAWLK